MLLKQSKKSRPSTKSGFTIVEISIATAFLSVLMIIISVIIINVVNIYQKGTVMKNLNSTGRALVDDIEKSIEAAAPTNIISETQTNTKYQWNKYYQSTEGGDMGVFCTGQYSYIWADASHDSGSGSPVTLQYHGGSRGNIRLLKVKDRYRNICQAVDLTHPTTTIVANDLSPAESEIEELLNDSEVDFFVSRFIVNKIDGNLSLNQTRSNVSEAFFSGSFTLGTKRGVQYDNSTRLSNCKIGADDADGEFNYCAVNKFKFAARTAGKVF